MEYGTPYDNKQRYAPGEIGVKFYFYFLIKVVLVSYSGPPLAKKTGINLLFGE